MYIIYVYYKYIYIHIKDIHTYNIRYVQTLSHSIDLKISYLWSFPSFRQVLTEAFARTNDEKYDWNSEQLEMIPSQGAPGLL